MCNYIKYFNSDVSYEKIYLVGGGLGDILRELFSNGILYNFQNNRNKKYLLLIACNWTINHIGYQTYDFLSQFNNVDVIVFANYGNENNYDGNARKEILDFHKIPNNKIIYTVASNNDLSEYYNSRLNNTLSPYDKIHFIMNEKEQVFFNKYLDKKFILLSPTASDYNEENKNVADTRTFSFNTINKILKILYNNNYHVILCHKNYSTKKKLDLGKINIDSKLFNTLFDDDLTINLLYHLTIISKGTICTHSSHHMLYQTLLKPNLLLLPENKISFVNWENKNDENLWRSKFYNENNYNIKRYYAYSFSNFNENTEKLMNLFLKDCD
jgi:hypothetical protein